MLALTNFIRRVSLPLLAFLLPLFFLPVTTDFFNTNKQLLLIIIASLVLLATAVNLFLTPRPRLTLTPATLPLLALGLIAVLSSLLFQPNRFLSLSGQTTNLVALSLFFISLTILPIAPNLTAVLNALFLSLGLSSLVVIYQFTGLSARLTEILWLQNSAFNPVGGPLPFLAFAAPLLPALIYLAFRTTSSARKILYFIIAGLSLLASFIFVSLLLPKNGTPQLLLLPVSAGWDLAVDTFKNLKLILLGVGPESFTNAFTRAKPLYLNQSNLWTLRFDFSSNQYFHLLTTLGALALVFYLLAFLRPLTTKVSDLKSKLSAEGAAVRIILILSLLAQLLIPANLVLLSLSFIALTVLVLDLYHLQPHSFRHLDFFPASGRHPLSVAILILALALVGANGYFRFHAYAGELAFFRSLQFASENKGTDTYNAQIAAIQHAPYQTRYRIAYSQTNLALANSIASQTNLSEADQTNITQLIQQSIREAKAATALDPQSSLAWSNLANIYRQLINLAQGSQQWAIAAYTQAIVFDPLNPQLRVDLGGVYYALKDYDNAIRLFQQAIEAKPDWANAHYNLSHTYLDNKQYPQAIQSLRVVTKLLDANSPDYQKAQDELKNLETKYPQTTRPTTDLPTSELQTPTPLPSPSISPILLPDGSGLNLPDQQPEPSTGDTPPPQP